MFFFGIGAPQEASPHRFTTCLCCPEEPFLESGTRELPVVAGGPRSIRSPLAWVSSESWNSAGGLRGENCCAPGWRRLVRGNLKFAVARWILGRIGSVMRFLMEIAGGGCLRF